MSRAGRLAFAAIALVLATGLLWDGNGARLLSAVTGPRAMLDVSSGHGGGSQSHATPAPGAVQVLPRVGADPSVARVLTNVSVQRAARKESGYTVQVRLTAKEGVDVNGVAVAFYDVRDLLGPREMLIGTATTGGLGRAQITYLPAEAGTHLIVARPVAYDSLQAAEGRTSFVAQVVAPPSYARELLPLDSFSAPLPLVALAALAVIWGIFAVVVLGSLIRIPSGAARVIAARRRAREL